MVNGLISISNGSYRDTADFVSRPLRPVIWRNPLVPVAPGGCSGCHVLTVTAMSSGRCRHTLRGACCFPRHGAGQDGGEGAVWGRRGGTPSPRVWFQRRSGQAFPQKRGAGRRLAVGARMGLGPLPPPVCWAFSPPAAAEFGRALFLQLLRCPDGFGLLTRSTTGRTKKRWLNFASLGRNRLVAGELPTLHVAANDSCLAEGSGSVVTEDAFYSPVALLSQRRGLRGELGSGPSLSRCHSCRSAGATSPQALAGLAGDTLQARAFSLPGGFNRKPTAFIRPRMV